MVLKRFRDTHRRVELSNQRPEVRNILGLGDNKDPIGSRIWHKLNLAAQRSRVSPRRGHWLRTGNGLPGYRISLLAAGSSFALVLHQLVDCVRNPLSIGA